MGSNGGIEGGLVNYKIDKLMREVIDLVCKLAHTDNRNDQITLRSLIRVKLDKMREIQNGRPHT